MNVSATSPRTGAVVSVLASAGIMVSVMQTLVVPLIPQLPGLLGTSVSNASWVITATLLTAAVATPVVGRLGDLYGKRRLLLLCGLLLMAMSPLAARLAGARGPKISLLIGISIIACGDGLGQVLMGTTWGVLVFTLVVSAGVSFAYASMPTLIMGAVPLSETAAANGLNALARSLGTSTSSAVIGVVLSQMTIRLGPVSLPSEDGIRVCLAIGAGAAVIAGLIALVIPRRGEPARTATSEAASERRPAPEEPTREMIET